MKACSKECSRHPCCDFCVYAIQGVMEVDGQTVTSGPEGCKLHDDEYHQEMARNLGYCEDFECFNYQKSIADNKE